MGYFERGLLAAIIIGAVCGLVGTLVVLRRRTFFAQALTHATFPGAMAAAVLGWSIPLGAAIAAVGLVAGMSGIARIRNQGGQVAAGIVLTAGFALGVLMQSLAPQVPVRIDSYLVGSILTVTELDLVLAATVLILALATIAITGRRIVFSTFDPVGYRAAGYSAWPIELVVLGLATATVVVALPAVGAILAIALIAAPAAAARMLAPSMRWMLVTAPVIGAASGVLGVLGSRALAIAAGPAIALAACGFFALAVGVRRMRAIPWRAGAVPVETAEGARAA
jgi:zinc/manganese transport system permease protein